MQFHPEYQSTVGKPHPLFKSFIKATINKEHMAESKVDYSQLIGFLFLMAALSHFFISHLQEEIDIQVEENIAINDSFNANRIV